MPRPPDTVTRALQDGDALLRRLRRDATPSSTPAVGAVETAAAFLARLGLPDVVAANAYDDARYASAAQHVCFSPVSLTLPELEQLALVNGPDFAVRARAKSCGWTPAPASDNAADDPVDAVASVIVTFQEQTALLLKAYRFRIDQLDTRIADLEHQADTADMRAKVPA